MQGVLDSVLQFGTIGFRISRKHFICVHTKSWMSSSRAFLMYRQQAEDKEQGVKQLVVS